MAPARSGGGDKTPASCCNQEMTKRGVASVLVTGCVLALISGSCLAEAQERAHGQNDRLQNDLHEPPQHQVGYMRPAALRGWPLDEAAELKSSAVR